jgi:transcriptional regulator with XRE-family HTH domain
MPRPDGATLRAWRMSRHLAVPEMARQLRRTAGDVHIAEPDALKQMIWKWERNTVRITERYMLLYCAVFEVTPEQLRDGPVHGSDTVVSRPVPASPVTPQPPAARWAAGVYQAVIHSGEAARRASRLTGEPPPLTALRRRAEAAVAAELAADYALLAAALPDLIGTAELAAIHAPDRYHLAAHDLLAHVYTTAAWALIKADTAGAAWIAAQRAVQLAAAASCAELMRGERTDFGTVFGPVNTAIHRVAVAVELGDYRAALAAVPAVNLTRLPADLAERRARYLIDVARTYAGVRDDKAAADALLEAEQAAPDELRGHRLTRAVLADLLTRERKSSGIRQLAARCGVPGV